MKNWTKYRNQPDVETRRIGKACQDNEIKMVRPLRENARGQSVKTYTPWTYYRVKRREGSRIWKEWESELENRRHRKEMSEEKRKPKDCKARNKKNMKPKFIAF